MKVSVQQYVKKLYSSVAGKSEKEAQKELKNFVALLGRNRSFNKADEIIRVFNDLWNKENKEVVATLVSARALMVSTKEILTDYLKERTGAKKITLHEAIDKKLIGGFVLKYDSKVLDGSLKTYLDQLKVVLEG